MNNLKALSLFSGCGGDTLGLHLSNINVTHYVEYIKEFQKSHELNFPDCELLGKDTKQLGDITKIQDETYNELKGKINVIFSGFPCQSFSSAGKKKEDDPRNTMFIYFVKAVSCILPQIIIGENVKGLLTKKTSNKELYIDIICREFQKIGYTLKYQVIKCNEYGVPQKRERLFIIGIRNDVLHQYNLSFPLPHTDSESFGLLNIIKYSMNRSIKITKEQFDFNSIPQECILTNMNDDSNEQNPHPYIISKVRGPIEKRTYQNVVYQQILSFGKRASPIHLEIIDIRKPCKTIICTYEHQPRLFIPIQNKNGYFLRMLTIEELLQIQSFHKNYQLHGTDKQKIIQIGNSVPPLIVNKLIQHIIQ